MKLYCPTISSFRGGTIENSNGTLDIGVLCGQMRRLMDTSRCSECGCSSIASTLLGFGAWIDGKTGLLHQHDANSNRCEDCGHVWTGAPCPACGMEWLDDKEQE